MKRALIAPLLLMACIITSFTYKQSTITLQDALAQKKIDLKIAFDFKGDYHDITLDIKNLSGEGLSLQIPEGTLYAPGDTNEQILVNPEDLYVKVEQGETKSLKSLGFCTQFTHHGSTTASTFSLGFTKNQKLKTLVHFLDSTKVDEQESMQHAIWCVTNDHNVSNVYLGDTAKSHALSNLLCSLTGQKSTWYTAEEKIVRNEENEFVLEPQNVKGAITFHSDVQVEIQGCIKDDNGKILYQNPRKSFAGPGDVDFDFELSVQGWKKGTYHVVYTSNGAQLLDQPFTI